MLFERWHTKNRKRFVKQHIKYLNFSGVKSSYTSRYPCILHEKRETCYKILESWKKATDLRGFAAGEDRSQSVAKTDPGDSRASKEPIWQGTETRVKNWPEGGKGDKMPRIDR